MADNTQAHEDKDVKVLFKQWRSGDPDAGITMAQRFSDWYYAITVIRLGDQRARAPLEAACQVFAQRIMEVTNAEDLIDFAHHIVLEQLRAAGGPATGGDHPNGITGNRRPSELLRAAAGSLSASQRKVLHGTYTGSGTIFDLDPDMPFVALEARHALKRALKEQSDIPFSVVDEVPDLDRGPLPLYEADRLASDDEVRLFEQWLLTDIELCKDLAEFSAFAHALRAGAFEGLDKSDLGSSPASTRPTTSRPTTPIDSPRPTPDLPTPPAPEPDGAGGGLPRGALIGGGVAALLAIAGILYALFGG